MQADLILHWYKITLFLMLRSLTSFIDKCTCITVKNIFQGNKSKVTNFRLVTLSTKAICMYDIKSF